MAARGGRGGRGRGCGAPPNLDEVNARIDEMAQNIANIAAALNNPNPNVGGGNAPARGTNYQGSQAPTAVNLAQVVVEDLSEDYLKYLDRFQRMQPKIFEGTSDLDLAEAWILLMEKYFKGLRCKEEYKVSLAAFTLEGEAEHWYR